MGLNRQSFVVFEQNLRSQVGRESWPAAIAIPQLSDGEGSFGVIYHLMRRDGVPSDCCLKVFKSLVCPLPADADPFDIDEPPSWKRAHDEYDKLCRLNGLHGHTPTAYAFGAIVGDAPGGGRSMRPAFIMEDMSGAYRPLHAVDSPRSTEDVAGFGLELLQVIKQLRARGIVHADFSEGNIMVAMTPDGGRIDRVAVVDFGQGKESTEAVTPTNQGFRLGTMPFAAPEILPLAERGRGASEPEFAREHRRAFASRNKYTVDIWSLGALLYLLRSGEKPPLSTRFSKTRNCYVDADGRTVTQDLAFESIIAEKRAGLSLAGAAAGSPQDRALDEAIRICTDAVPEARDLVRIEALLQLAASEGADGPANEDVTPDMPVAGGMETVLMAGGAAAGGAIGGAGAGVAAGAAAAAPDTAAGSGPAAPAPGAVCAAVYRMVRPDGTPYSYRRAQNLLVLGATPADVRTRSCIVYGARFGLEPAGDPVDLSACAFEAGGQEPPWQEISYAYVCTPVAPARMQGWFLGCRRLREIFGMELVDTSAVDSMRGLFEGCAQLQRVNTGGFNTGAATDLSGMFDGCRTLPELDVSGFDLGRAERLDRMFAGCSSLEHLEGCGFEAPAGASTRDMFLGCPWAQDCGLDWVAALLGAGADAGAGAGAGAAAGSGAGAGVGVGSGAGAGAAASADAAAVGEPAAPEGEAGFSVPPEFRPQGGPAAPGDVFGAFYRLEGGDAADPDVLVLARSCERAAAERVLTVDGGPRRLTLLGAPGSREVDMARRGSYRLLTAPACFASISYVYIAEPLAPTSMERWFYGCANLRQIIGLAAVDTGAVKSMSYLFHDCRRLRRLDLSCWSTRALESMFCLFDGCSQLERLELLSWDTARVWNMDHVFDGCRSLVELDLSSWDVGKVWTASFLFNNCSSLRRLDLSGWRTVKLQDAFAMFKGCSSLEQLDISSFSSSALQSADHLFDGCSSLERVRGSRGFSLDGVRGGAPSAFDGCPEGLREAVGRDAAPWAAGWVTGAAAASAAGRAAGSAAEKKAGSAAAPASAQAAGREMAPAAGREAASEADHAAAPVAGPEAAPAAGRTAAPDCADAAAEVDEQLELLVAELLAENGAGAESDHEPGHEAGPKPAPESGPESDHEPAPDPDPLEYVADQLLKSLLLEGGPAGASSMSGAWDEAAALAGIQAKLGGGTGAVEGSDASAGADAPASASGGPAPKRGFFQRLFGGM